MRKKIVMLSKPLALGFDVEMALCAVPIYKIRRHEPRIGLDEKFTFRDEDVQWLSPIEARENTCEKETASHN